MSLLAADDIWLSAPVPGGRADVLRDVSFAIEPGRMLGVVGESGAGKSMIGRLVAQMLPPGFAVDRGSLRFQGRELIDMDARRRAAMLGKDIAFIPQHPMTSLNPVRTIGAQFDEHLRRLGIASAAERRERAIAGLGAVHLPEPAHLLKRYPHQISGGQCQRVLIAMAFASEPALIIADEPTTALDVITQARIMALIEEMRAARSTAILFITHDLRLAAQMCDEIMVMYAGEVVERSPADRLFAQPRHPYTRCLQRANPNLTGPRRHLVSLPDHMPGISAFAALPGCRFAPRCPVAHDDCAGARPALSEVAAGHFVRAEGACLTTTPDFGAETVPAAAVRKAGRGQGPLLEVSGLAKTFRGRRNWLGAPGSDVDAVKDFSLALHPGEFVGIVGESGSGKSTVARMLLGLEVPTQGRIVIDSLDVTGPFIDHAAERVGLIQMVFQDPQSALNPRRRIGRLVTQPMEAAVREVSWPERLKRARALLRDAGLAPDTIDRYPAQVSGGQRQRVNIARALCAAPKLLVADEIVSGLDVSIQAQILNLLLRLRDESDVSLLFISHDLSVVRYLCSRVLVMYRGDVVEQGETERVFAEPQHRYTKALLAAVPPDDAKVRWTLDAIGERADAV